MSKLVWKRGPSGIGNTFIASFNGMRAEVYQLAKGNWLWIAHNSNGLEDDYDPTGLKLNLKKGGDCRNLTLEEAIAESEEILLPSSVAFILEP